MTPRLTAIGLKTDLLVASSKCIQTVKDLELVKASFSIRTAQAALVLSPRLVWINEFANL